MKIKGEQNDYTCAIMQFARKNTLISQNVIANLANGAHNGAHQQENPENETSDQLFKIKKSQF